MWFEVEIPPLHHWSFLRTMTNDELLSLLWVLLWSIVSEDDRSYIIDLVNDRNLSDSQRATFLSIINRGEIYEEVP